MYEDRSSEAAEAGHFPQVSVADQSEVSPDDFGDVSGVVLAHLLGARLACLDDVPDSVAGDGELVDVATGLARLEAWAVAQRARVTGLLRTRTCAELRSKGMVHADSKATAAGLSHGFDDDMLADRTVSTDLALALGITPWSADREVDLASGVAAFPALGRAMAAGRLDRRRAELVLDEVSHLAEHADRARVVAAVVGDGSHASEVPGAQVDPIKPLRVKGSSLWQLQPDRLRRALRSECARLDPEATARRAVRAGRGRRLEHRILPDAMGELRFEAPGYAVAAAYTNVDRAARALRSGGDPRTLDQLRCDIGVGWLTEGALGTYVVRPDPRGETEPVPAGEAASSADRAHRGDAIPRRAVVSRPKAALIALGMPAKTALGLDEEPVTMFGPGGPTWLPAAIARQIAHDPQMSTWLGLFTDRQTGIAVDISSRYRPPPRMRTFIQLRDGMRSRLPIGSGVRIELDHLRPYNHQAALAGGRTTPAELACLGLREHHLKTDGMLRVSGDANGPLTFHTHTGHSYFSWPELWEPMPGFVDLQASLRLPPEIDVAQPSESSEELESPQKPDESEGGPDDEFPF